MRSIEILYGKIVRSLLGVKTSTPLYLCLIEAGMQPINDMILTQRKKFMEKMADVPDDYPLKFALNLTDNLLCYEMRSFKKYLDFTPQDLQTIITELSAEKSRYATYLYLNPSLSQHPVYMSNAIRDSLRIQFSQLMLSSHHLRIETGRWNRPPTPRDARICQCGTDIQTEEHVLLRCSRTAQERHRFSVLASWTFPTMLQEMETDSLLNLIARCLDKFL